MTGPAAWASGLPALPRPLVMGVVNVTPDSFSDGGRFESTDRAVAHAMALREQGADLLDIGGESTRPGATRPLVAEELGRVVPVIRVLASEGVPVSVDTMRHEVARAALEAGAVLVNDVSGGLADPRILDVVAERGAAYVVMHWRAHADVMTQHAAYDDVVADVRAELAQRLDDAAAHGIAEDRLVVDPGLGFAKTATHNWQLLRRLPELGCSACPCSWAPAASRSWAACWPPPTAPRGRSGTARTPAWRSPRSPRSRACGGSGCTRCGPAWTRSGWSPAGWSRRSRRSGRSARGCVGSHAGRRFRRLRCPPVVSDHHDPDPARPPRRARTAPSTGTTASSRLERREGQDFVVDLVLGLDTSLAAASDDLHDTVDYGTLVDAGPGRGRARPGRPDRDAGPADRRRLPGRRPSPHRGRDPAQAARTDPGHLRRRRPDHHPEPNVTPNALPAMAAAPTSERSHL